MRLIVLGAGGSAYDLLDIVDACNRQAPAYEVVGILDDGRAAGSEFAGHPVLGGVADAARFTDCQFVNTIGSDRSYRMRGRIVEKAGVPLSRFATLIHPLAAVSSRAIMGAGVLVNAGVSVGGLVRIGNHAMLCPGSIVGHEAVIGDHCVIAPGAVVSGLVSLGNNCYLGARSVVRQQLTVGEGALVGMGAVVIRNVDCGEVVVGCPARRLRTSDG